MGDDFTVTEMWKLAQLPVSQSTNAAADLTRYFRSRSYMQNKKNVVKRSYKSCKNIEAS